MIPLERWLAARSPIEIRRWPGNPTAAPSRTRMPALASASRAFVASATFTSRKFACEG